MAPKKQNYSFRLSDKAVAIIDKQQGETRTEKFENLVFKLEDEKSCLKQQIASLEQRLNKLQENVRKVSAVDTALQNISRHVSMAANYIQDLK